MKIEINFKEIEKMITKSNDIKFSRNNLYLGMSCSCSTKSRSHVENINSYFTDITMKIAVFETFKRNRILVITAN